MTDTLTAGEAQAQGLVPTGMVWDEETQKPIERGGVPVLRPDALETGLWPSDDVMPDADRRRRGRAVTPSALVWQPPNSVATAAE